jgi:hypothetical protein
MRIVGLVFGLAALGFASTAVADDVSLTPVSYSPQFQTALTDNYGLREGEYLQVSVTRAVSAALARRGVTLSSDAPISIDISIVDAQPNAPTMAQLFHTPGLDPIRSVSIGGAQLRAVLRDAQGQQIGEVNHRRYNYSIEEYRGLRPTTWQEADWAIHQFAEKVADAYVAHQGAH